MPFKHTQILLKNGHMKIVNATATTEYKIASMRLHQGKLFCFITHQNTIKVMNLNLEVLYEFEHENMHSFWEVSEDVIATARVGQRITFFDSSTGILLKDFETPGFNPIQAYNGVVWGYILQQGTTELIVCSVSLESGVERHGVVKGVFPTWVYNNICFCRAYESERQIAIDLGSFREVLNEALPDAARRDSVMGECVDINVNNIVCHNEYVVFHYIGTMKRNVCFVNLKTLEVNYDSFLGYVMHKDGVVYSIDSDFKRKLVVYNIKTKEKIEEPFEIAFPAKPTHLIQDQYTLAKGHFLIFIVQIFKSSKNDFELIIYNTKTFSIHERWLLPKFGDKKMRHGVGQMLLIDDNLYVVTNLGMVIHVKLEF